LDLGLRGKVALVSASSKGLGRAIAEELAAEGANLVVCARGEEALRQTADSIRKSSGVTVGEVSADVSEQSGIDRVAKTALDKFGKVDILVTNSGGPPSGPFESLTPEMWEAATRLLHTSAVGLARALLPGMKERRWGRVVAITSIAVRQPIPNITLSNSLRAAVTGLAKTLSRELGREAITVNCLAPDAILTLDYDTVFTLGNVAHAVGGRAYGGREDAIDRPSQVHRRWARVAQQLRATLECLHSRRTGHLERHPVRRRDTDQRCAAHGKSPDRRSHLVGIPQI